MSLTLLAYCCFFSSTAPLTLSQRTSQATSHSGTKTPRAIQKRCLMSVSLSNLMLELMDHSRGRLKSRFNRLVGTLLSRGLRGTLALPTIQIAASRGVNRAAARPTPREITRNTHASGLLDQKAGFAHAASAAGAGARGGGARIGRGERHQAVGRRRLVPEEQDDEY